MLASLFREAGFPPGVVNYICHRPQDASEVYDSMITQRAVKKCNFTGSTAVGRIIASKAAQALKPVLLELGGKNYALVLDDADLDLAAEHIVRGAFLNVSCSPILGLQKKAFMSLLIEIGIERPNLHVHRPGHQLQIRQLRSGIKGPRSYKYHQNQPHRHLSNRQNQAREPHL